jgi:hypothetical protein
MPATRPPDPVDLMLEGKYAEAAKAYATLYAEAVAKHNLAVGPDLLMGFQYCIAAMKKQAPADDSIGLAIEAALEKYRIRVTRQVREDLQVANAMVKEAKKKSERSVARVESEKRRLTADE